MFSLKKDARGDGYDEERMNASTQAGAGSTSTPAGTTATLLQQFRGSSGNILHRKIDQQLEIRRRRGGCL